MLDCLNFGKLYATQGSAYIAAKAVEE